MLTTNRSSRPHNPPRPRRPLHFLGKPLRPLLLANQSLGFVQVNHEGQVIAGGPNRLLNAAAFMIHSAIHAARPEVVCAAHSHSIHGRAFCSLGRPLDVISQDACAFFDVRPSTPPRFLHVSVVVCVGVTITDDDDAAGPRSLQPIQRHRARRRRRPQHRHSPGIQKSSPTPKPRTPHRRPHGRGNRLLVREFGKVLLCAVDGGCCGCGTWRWRADDQG